MAHVCHRDAKRDATDHGATTMNETHEPFDYDLAAGLRILKVTARPHAPGTWVTGVLDEFRFEALVFAEHADERDQELGESRIAKLWIARRDTKRTVFNWDRGLDIPAASDKTQAVADFLAAGLAEHVFGR
ncbi:MAG TPA: hypothetical protein DCQ98_17500 [Planctomycetaceae bacterium]|nr:hypothetical protein [Planctomycetaceae bacterium]